METGNKPNRKLNADGGRIGLKEGLGSFETSDPKEAMKEVVKSRLQEFGTAGNASSINSISLGEMSKKYKSGEFKAIIN